MAQALTTDDDEINAQPTKSFFVEMLVRDIPLEQAVLDLVDNSVDGAKSMNGDDFSGRSIKIDVNSDIFGIWDDCGGFSREIARKYAFRFGRLQSTPRTPHSIGQFGVGMKRALFKFGKHFLEPIQGHWIHVQGVDLVKRRSMSLIMARRMKAATVRA